MIELREDIRCSNCGAYAPEALEQVAELLDKLAEEGASPSLISAIIKAWEKV